MPLVLEGLRAGNGRVGRDGRGWNMDYLRMVHEECGKFL